MAALALKALSLGAEKIPDKAFHAVPGGYFRPQDAVNNRDSRSSSRRKKERDAMHDNSDRSDGRGERSDRRERHRHRRKSDDYSASESGSDTEEDTRRRRAQRPTRRNRRYTSSQKLERGYDSDGMTRDQYQQSRGMPPPSQPGQDGQYFPPPPAHAYGDDENYHQDNNAPRFTGVGVDGAFDGQASQGGAYNYAQQASPAPQTRQPYPEFGTTTQQPASDHYQPYSPPPQSWEPKRNSFNPSYTPHAGYADNYVAAYQPSQQPGYYPPQGGPNQGALAVQPPTQEPDAGYSTALAPYNMPPPQSDPAMNGSYPTYVPPQDNWTPSRSPSRHRHRHSRSQSRGGRSSRDSDRSRSRSRSRDRHRGRDSDRQSKSRNRSRSMAAQAKEALKSNRDVASSALGVVAGGLIGNQVGRGNKFGTLAGAVLGGFGANMWEKKHADKKESREKRHHHHRDDEVAREYQERERRQQQQQQYDSMKQYHNAAYRRLDSDYGERSARASRDMDDRRHSFRERSRHPYTRSSLTTPMYTPQPSSPHVHFAQPEPMPQPTSTTSRRASYAGDGRLDRSNGKDASTQTPKWSNQRYYQSRHKDDARRASEKERLSKDEIYQAARAYKTKTRKGTWDGSVVQEVFMEMTGVSIGDPDHMKSCWDN